MNGRINAKAYQNINIILLNRGYYRKVSRMNQWINPKAIYLDKCNMAILLMGGFLEFFGAKEAFEFRVSCLGNLGARHRLEARS